MINLLQENIEMESHPQIAHLQFAQADTQTKNCKRAIFLPDPQVD